MIWNQENQEKIVKELMEQAYEKNIAFEVYGNQRVIAMVCPQTLSSDKINWLRRKRNTVLRFSMSSLDVSEKNKGNEAAFVEKYGISREDYTLTYGGVPIFDEHHNLVGVVSVTGLTPEEDHEIATASIQAVL